MKEVDEQPEELLKTLRDMVEYKEELISFKEINKSITKTLESCFYYSLDFNNQGKDTNKQFEIESVLDFLHEELNTGHWSEVPLSTRRCFTSASFVKCLTLLKCAQSFSVILLRECLKCLDLGLLLGAPLELNPELLTASASTLTQVINRKCEENLEIMEYKEVSVKRKLDNRTEYEGLKAKEIECSNVPSLECFNKHYFTPQIPVKLQGCMNYWPATKKWLDINYFLSTAGDRTVPIEIGSHYVDANWSQKLMTLKEFVINHYLEKSDSIGYLAQHNLFEQIPELKEDICIPDYCSLSLDYENSTDPDINAWFGPKGTVSPLHFDPKNNLLAQVYGTKQLLLFSPEDSPFLYPHEESMLFNTARVNPVEPDLETYPEFSKATMFKCLLEPGEILFMPVKWWHHVTAMDKSFSVSFWWQ
ncbi:hypothetical protein NQ317_010620 [Molorchus minor]|uniref:JmjC domain-containing protein n=1 Tax=Molorchus minor TaxID=1323400 RepID=A0ABQ9JBD3_9CUCU|nr:hypothetical protein NQ317_010620 [Molorchus minor]